MKNLKNLLNIFMSTYDYNPIVYKRLNRELKLYNDSYYKYNIDVYSVIAENENSERKHLLVSIKNKDNSIFFKLILPNDYPFKPYIYYSHLSNFSYYKYIRNINTHLKKNNIDKNIIDFFYTIYHNRKSNFLKLVDNDCFCCNSLFCYNNWVPSYNITNVINEVEEIKFIDDYKNHYNELKYIYNECYISRLPQDLITKILNIIII